MKPVLSILFCVGVALLASETLAVDLPETMELSDGGSLLIQGKQDPTGLYDQTILRSMHLTFQQVDWWEQLLANRTSETDIPADLTVDGVTYEGVGVRFKGATSFSRTGDSLKKSFNISVDFTQADQRLMGYKTLNLNNSFSDATFMREVLYFTAMRKYSPVPKSSFVKLMINGGNWGVYTHVQQLNSDLVDEWFTNDNGNRWKAGIPAGAGGGT